MDQVALGSLTGLTIVSAVALARYARVAGARSAAHTFARKVDLALDGRMEGEVGRRVARREQAGILGGLVVAAAAVLLGARLAGDEYGGYVLFFLFLAFFAGHATGCGAVAWYESTRPVDLTHPRIARTSTPGFDDYVPRHERYGARVLAAVSAAVTLLLVVLDSSGAVELQIPFGLAIATAAGPAVVCVVVEAVARRLLERRQVAASTLDLAWDDALRARTLRDLITVALAAGVFAPLVLLGAVGNDLSGGWPANPAVGVVDGLFGVLLLGMVGMAVVSLVLRPEAHFRRRLWPREAGSDTHAVGNGLEAAR